MIRSSRYCSLALLATCFACDGGAGTTDAGDPKKEAAEGGDPKAEEAPKEEAPKVEKKEKVHFDIDQDTSGILARAAAVLETTESISEEDPVRAHLADLSHHAEKLESDEKLCTKIADIRKEAGKRADPPEVCVIHFEHEMVKLGPDVFAQMVDCIKAAKTMEDIDGCEEAEKEAETLLHEKHPGDGLSAEECAKFFNKFEELAKADSGQEADVVVKILEELKADVVSACVDHGTKKELECVEKADKLEALGSCDLK